MDVKLMASRAALSSLAWEKARWRDGRRVILAPPRTDMAMQGPTCRVMPSEQRGKFVGRTDASGYRDWVYTDPDPIEEAITMTWDQAALVLLQPIAMFGLYQESDRTKAP